MDLSTIRNRVFSYINYVDSSGDPLTGKDITATEVDQWINDRYLDDLVPELADRNPDYFSKEITTDNYAATGTVDATATGSTLVATTSIFNSNMVNAIVYNSTDSESRTIVGYTSATTVTLDSDIDDDWDGDTIYVFTGLYPFGTGADDVFSVLWVGVKYDSTDYDYRRAEPMADEDVYSYQRGKEANEVQQQSYPRYIYQAETVSDVLTSTVKIVPFDWDEAISDSVYIRYAAKPDELSDDADVPRLPLSTHKTLVFGATADAYMKLGEFEKANQFEQRYQDARKRLLEVRVSERTKRYVDFMKGTRSTYRRVY